MNIWLLERFVQKQHKPHDVFYRRRVYCMRIGVGLHFVRILGGAKSSPKAEKPSGRRASMGGKICGRGRS